MLGYFLICLACGATCFFVMWKKGYEREKCAVYAVMGLLFGLITLIVALCKSPQTEKAEETAYSTESQSGINVGELYEYKELLDRGVITQEEFELMKKHILNL